MSIPINGFRRNPERTCRLDDLSQMAPDNHSCTLVLESSTFPNHEGQMIPVKVTIAAVADYVSQNMNGKLNVLGAFQLA